MYIYAFCPKSKSHDSFQTENDSIDDVWVDEPDKCSKCGTEMKAVPLAECKIPEVILEGASMELEGANHHSMTSLPSNIYEAIKEYIPRKHRIAVAKEIAEQTTRNI